MQLDARWPAVVGSIMIIGFCLVWIALSFYWILIKTLNESGGNIIAIVLLTIVMLPGIISLLVSIFLTQRYSLLAGLTELIVAAQGMLLAVPNYDDPYFGKAFLIAGYSLIGLGGVLTMFRFGLI